MGIKRNYQPRRGGSQTSTTGGNFSAVFLRGDIAPHGPTAGDAALLAQNTQYEKLSQDFVGSISVVRNGKDLTNESQKQLLAINVQLTSASALAYQPTATADFWSNGITDWLAVYNAQVALAESNGWS